MGTTILSAPIANSSSKVQAKKAVKRHSQTLHILAEHGIGMLLCAGLALCSALSFTFGLFLLNGWSIAIGIATAFLCYILFTNKDYDELSIKEALEILATGKEVGR